MINGPIWVKPGHAAVVIPLLAIGSPRITVRNRDGRTYDVAWNAGSVHYLGEDMAVDMDNGGRVGFIFLLFKMLP